MRGLLDAGNATRAVGLERHPDRRLDAAIGVGYDQLVPARKPEREPVAREREALAS
jgi:hypothetical protein